MPLLLKSLELQGYKTFASKTAFQFAGQITAIVGPNGSGKSNIADSLRWVLGEQSYSLLRGKKTEDMIFSGSEQRPRAGMATATLIFDNSDGWLPIDFSEVAIARRAYRDGTNDYLINGQRVRLKDVSELLAESGLAERTYTIIGQGLVDAALSLKAEERRRLFEEAAGIGLHRSRREEALRRLDTTRRNLERVEDILAELQPRLRSLERQARRAQEYEQVKADLRVLLRDWYGYHWHHAQRELTAARQEVRRQEAALARANQANRESELRLAGLRDRQQTLRAGLNAWHRQAAQLHSQREAQSRELAVGEARQRALEEQLAEAETTAARVVEDLSLRAARLTQAEEETRQRQAELEEARRQAREAVQALQARLAERKAAVQALEGARQKLAQAQDRRSRLQARQTERQAQVERDRRALESAQAALEQARQILEQARLRVTDTQVKAADLEERRRQAAETLQAQRGRIEAAVHAREAARKALAEAQAARARAQAQWEVLEGAEQALQGYAAGTQSLLKANPKGLRGTLIRHLEVPAELERAIGAALGEYLDAVLLEAGPEESLDVLQRERLRGVLLPLGRLKPTPALNGDARDQVVGVAADLIGAPPELRPVVDLLLGQTLVARDRATALRLVQGAEPPLRVVTLGGELFLASGPAFSGEAGGGKGSSLLGRQRQRRELEQALQDQDRALDRLAAEVNAAEDNLQAMLAREGEFGAALHAAEQKAAQAAQVHQAARLDLQNAEKQVAWQRSQQERMQAELERGAAQDRTLAGELRSLEEELQTLETRVRESGQALAGLPVDDRQAQVAHWNTLAAVAERAVVEAGERQGERARTRDRAQGEADRLAERLREIRSELERLQGERVKRRAHESELAGQIEAVQALIEPAEAELSALEDEQNGLQEQETATRQALSQAEHRHAQARITLASRQESFETLRRRIEDDFGLVEFEYDDSVSGPKPLPLTGMVEQLPRIEKLAPEVEENLKRQRAQLRRMGPVNPDAQKEYLEVQQRFQFMTEQVADLQAAEADVRQVIAELDDLMEQAFLKTFEAVAEEFRAIFTRLFGGGTARLVLTDPDDLTETGIDIEARLPGRRTQGLSLLSGGERSLTATALVFSLLKISPTPFCVLDEVDAMLDEANVGRFRDLLRELSHNTQFVVVTHNRNTVQAADVIYGVTMGRDSASQVVSLKMDEVSRVFT